MHLTDTRLRVRSVFISDLHLGTRGSQADMLLDFLQRTECETLYLVGDIFDGWRLRKSWYWHENFDAIVRHILGMARRGVKVIYIPGNHDEALRGWLGLEIAGIRLQPEAVHEAADGRQYLVIHGDEFDGVIRYAKFLAHLGDWAYEWALVINRVFNVGRRWCGYPYWSLSQWLKLQVKGAVKAIDNFEQALAGEAKRRGLDGVICGHIHHAEQREVHGIRYMNSGDWVESCSALVEHRDGQFALIDWVAAQRMTQGGPAPAEALA